MNERTYWSGGVFHEIVDGVLRQQTPKENGVGRWWHANGQLAKEINLKNGLAEDVIREWHDNGQLAIERPVTRGKTNGAVRQWNRDGILLGEYKMVMGVGIKREWHEDGSLNLEMDIVAPGCSRGKVWDDKGKAREQCLWNGRPISKKKYQEKLEKLCS